jgi:hypothetical protein
MSPRPGRLVNGAELPLQFLDSELPAMQRALQELPGLSDEAAT